jgi:UDP-glucose 4-epimerase
LPDPVPGQHRTRSLVTGGAGFIGSNLVDALVARGDEVLVLDDLSTGREDNLTGAIEAGARLVRCDVADGESVAREVGAFAPEAVFHLAAQADVRKAVADPAFDARVNVLGTVNVLEATRAAGGAPVVFAATGGAVYGEGEGADLPFPESTPPAPETAYGASKLAGEIYVGLFERLHGIPGLALRFGNVYGPRQDPHGEAGVVAIFCGKLLAGEAPTVYGDGRQTRDYVFVDDAVRALVAASEALAAGSAPPGPLNVGTGEETSVLDLLEILLPLGDEELEPSFAEARPGEVQRVSIDPSRAEEALGWSARVSLADGLRATYESVRERG